MDSDTFGDTKKCIVIRMTTCSAAWYFNEMENSIFEEAHEFKFVGKRFFFFYIVYNYYECL